MEQLIFFHTDLFRDLGINMTIVFNTLFVVLILAVASFLATRRLNVYPGGMQNFMEVVVGGLHGAAYMTGSSLGKAAIFGRVAARSAIATLR